MKIGRHAPNEGVGQSINDFIRFKYQLYKFYMGIEKRNLMIIESMKFWERELKLVLGYLMEEMKRRSTLPTDIRIKEIDHWLNNCMLIGLSITNKANKTS